MSSQALKNTVVDKRFAAIGLNFKPSDSEKFGRIRRRYLSKYKTLHALQISDLGFDVLLFDRLPLSKFILYWERLERLGEQISPFALQTKQPFSALFSRKPKASTVSFKIHSPALVDVCKELFSALQYVPIPRRPFLIDHLRFPMSTRLDPYDARLLQADLKKDFRNGLGHTTASGLSLLSYDSEELQFHSTERRPLTCNEFPFLKTNRGLGIAYRV